MPAEHPRVAVMLVERHGAPSQREREAWDEALGTYAGGGTIVHLWPGPGPVPAGIDAPSAAAASAVRELPPDTVVVVAEASSVPGPHLLQRLVETLGDEPSRVVDARVLPVELTRVSDRARGYHLEDDADPSAAVLLEMRYPGDVEDGTEDGEDTDEDDDEDDDEVEDDSALTDPTVPGPAVSDNPSVHGGDASRDEPGVSHHDLEAQDGWVLRARVTGTCCCVTARHLPDLDAALMAPGSPTSGAELLDAAERAGLDVLVEDTAVVSLPVHLDWDARADRSILTPPDRPVEWSAHTHPAALPGSLIGAIARKFHLTPAGDHVVALDPEAPFLTIVTRTQGRRLHCLEDLLTCLAGQNDRDFEWLLMCHRTSPEETASVQEVVASAPAWLREKARVLEVERPGRASPLNDGFAAARGRYVVALDDDDTVLAHYVATFKSAAAANDGRVLRTVAVRQDVAPVGGIDTVCAVSVEDPFREWPMDFSLVDHLISNYSPIMTVAFPRGAYEALGLHFDESLDTTEDWDLVVRCASVLGVASVREITSVYRWWVHTGESSRALHSKAEWKAARDRVQKAFEDSVLLVAPEETRRLVASLQRARRESTSAHRMARRLATSQHEIILRMDEVKAAHDEAVATAQQLRERVKEGQEKVQGVRERLRTRHSRHLALLREADLLLAERPHARPGKSIVDLSGNELEALVERLRAEPAKRSWARRGR